MNVKSLNAIDPLRWKRNQLQYYEIDEKMLVFFSCVNEFIIITFFFGSSLDLKVVATAIWQELMAKVGSSWWKDKKRIEEALFLEGDKKWAEWSSLRIS